MLQRTVDQPGMTVPELLPLSQDKLCRVAVRKSRHAQLAVPAALISRLT
ncbi:MAG: hypothetical protein ACK5A1_02175 [Planctomyces sp.]|jgi:hypothetical protein|nr:hypothetical protein [Planctomyces sp.]